MHCCQAFFGVREGEHAKGKCPHVSDATKQSKKDDRVRDKQQKQAKAEQLKLRQQSAMMNIRTNKFPRVLEAAKMELGVVSNNHRQCPVCMFQCKKTSNPEVDPNWHVFYYNDCRYCPFSDPELVRQTYATTWRLKADRKNMYKRQKREHS